MNLALRRLTVSVALVALAGCANAQNLQIVPGADVDVGRGWSAYAKGDLPQALRAYRQAAERGDPLGQFNLAVMLIGGEGTAPDPRQGVDWLKRAAERGLARAQFSLAVFYERGQYVPRS